MPCDLFVRGARHDAIVKDISRGGVFVQAAVRAPVGTPVTLVIAPAAGRTEIRVAGRVVRAEPASAPPSFETLIGIGIEVMATGALGRLLHDARFAG
jgi:Tfp pilus assembly protein PilZ